MSEIIQLFDFDIFTWALGIILTLGKFLVSMFTSIFQLIILSMIINPIISALFIIMLMVGIFVGILKLIKLIPIL